MNLATKTRPIPPWIDPPSPKLPKRLVSVWAKRIDTAWALVEGMKNGKDEIFTVSGS